MSRIVFKQCPLNFLSDATALTKHLEKYEKEVIPRYKPKNE